MSTPTYSQLRPDPDAAPVLLAFHEAGRIRAAAFRAQNLYPGPVGELINRELLTFEEFGYRLGSHGLVNRLVDHVLKASP